jgi:hypothetical protein
MSYIFDAAVNGLLGFSGKAYFFRNNLYIRYDWATNQIDPGYPASVNLWHLPGIFATGVRAAVNGEGQFQNKTYGRFRNVRRFVEYVTARSLRHCAVLPDSGFNATEPDYESAAEVALAHLHKRPYVGR